MQTAIPHCVDPRSRRALRCVRLPQQRQFVQSRIVACRGVFRLPPTHAVGRVFSERARRSARITTGARSCFLQISVTRRLMVRSTQRRARAYVVSDLIPLNLGHSLSQFGRLPTLEPLVEERPR